MKFGDGLIGLFIVALGVAVFWHVQSFPSVPGRFYGPGLFPEVIAAGLLICGAIMLAGVLRAAPIHAFRVEAPSWRGNPRGVVSGITMLAAILSFIFLGDAVGFQIIGFVTLVAFYLWLGRPLPVALLVAAGVTLALDLLFRVVLHVPVPSGPLTELW
ncbi:MAG TPA: tripartite tricarboxylate transporter TctB family protein [Xanthobacteraceae bacterium]|nr:tripartite tricarboxylate transporter TctB family protein [Xanthobacteraceae bacterium]